MRKIKIVLWLAAAIIFVPGLYFAADRDGFWLKVAGDPDLGQTDFSRLAPASEPNEGLACPPQSLTDFCPLRIPDIETREIVLSPDKVRARLIEYFANDPLVIRVDDDSSPIKLRFVRRTPIMRYPDTLSVEIIELGPNRSSLAVHAKALVGKSDFGNNLDLVRQTLESLGSAP